MEQRTFASYTSSPYQYVVDYPNSHDMTRGNSQGAFICEPAHASYDERTAFHNFGRETRNAQPLAAPADAFDPWLLDGPPCGSPLSTTSTISHPESVPTPPFTGITIYEPIEQRFDHIQEARTSHCTYTSEPEPMWRPSYAEASPWGEQTCVLPYHSNPSGYQHMPPQPIQNYLAPTTTPAGHTLVTFDGAQQYNPTRVVDSTPFTRNDVNNNGGDISDISDSDGDDSEYDDSSSSSSRPTTKKRCTGSHGNIMKLEGWSTGLDTYNPASIPRNYQCTLLKKDHPSLPCLVKFARPEHLRRHQRTVHGHVRPWKCKVPGCIRPFSRGDNLRDHYFTHIERGGRVGKNRKMEFHELKALLGPKERKLVRKLKLKMLKHQEEQKRKAQVKAKL